MELVPINFQKIMQSRSYSVIILGNEKKRFAIYVEPAVGKQIQLFLTEEPKQRPFTHDLLNAIFKGFDIKLLQVVIHEVEDTVYFARLFLEKQVGDERQILEIDARPSDCLILALMHKAPIYCNKEVLEKAVAVTE